MYKVIRGSLLAVLGVCVFFPYPAQAQQPANRGQATRAADLTLQLAAERIEFAVSADRAAALRRLVRTAAARQAELSALVDSDPAAVLRLAFGSDARAAFPSEVQPFIEEEATVEGEAEVFQEDDDRGGRVRYFIRENGRQLRLHFAADAPVMLTGDVVRVRGVLMAGDMAVESGTASVVPVKSTLPYTFGEQPTLMILVNFQDLATQPYTTAAAHSMLFNTTQSFYAENSQNQVWFTGDVTGWHTISMSSTVCDISGVRTRAQAAASAAGFDLSRYRRFIYAFPRNACTWWGWGQIGGSPTHAWINGSLGTHVMAHELGHNFGLFHAHALECGTATLGSNCSTIEYGNYADVMGASGTVAHFNAFAKERLGWLNYGSSAPILTVTGSDTFTLDPYASPAYVPKALKILKEVNASTGRRTWYYVEFRRGIGWDSNLAGNTNLANGVVVHTGSESSGNSSFILDMTPATASWADPALTVGNSFADPAAGVTITTLHASSTGATVAIQTGDITCTATAPSVSMTPTGTLWSAPGTQVSWTVTVKNNDSAGCGATRFALGARVPSGWSSQLSSPDLVLDPGETAAASLGVTSAADAAEGFYTIEGSASAGSGTPAGKAAATNALLRGYDVQVSAGVVTSGKNRMATVVANVSASGSPAAGVSVSFTIVKADGSRVTGTGTTDVAGNARYEYKLRPKEPTGTWRATATASNGQVSGSGSTTFEVR